MKRGDVFLVQVAGDTEADRQLMPAVVVTRNALNIYGAVVVVAPIVDATALARLYPSDVHVQAPEGGLTIDGVVLAAQMRSVPRRRLIRQIGQLSDSVMRQVNHALAIVLDLEPPS